MESYRWDNPLSLSLILILYHVSLLNELTRCPTNSGITT